MSAPVYGPDYFERLVVDRTEWVDIERGLKATGAVKNKDLVLDVGGGTGELARWLAARGWRADFCDPYAPSAKRCALPYDVPPADVYVLQHVLEHVADVEASLRALAKADIIVIVAPGHLTDDPTHYYNHFVPWDKIEYTGLYGRITVYPLPRLLDVLKTLGYSADAVPDSRSYWAPWDTDWLIVASRRRRPRLLRQRIASLVARLILLGPTGQLSRR
ncbi:MAG: methyltransferase domain-containing protein [Pyrobaculum sp.]